MHLKKTPKTIVKTKDTPCEASSVNISGTGMPMENVEINLSIPTIKHASVVIWGRQLMETSMQVTDPMGIFSSGGKPTLEGMAIPVTCQLSVSTCGCFTEILRLLTHCLLHRKTKLS
jgi:hypothetical protein